MSLAEKFWSHVDKSAGPDACWPWTACLTRDGYGRVRLGSRRTRKERPAHRVSYELLVGPIPAGLTLDHLCRNRVCVNPAHLEPVTNAENVRRGESISSINARKTHCIRGHEFTPENTYRRPAGKGLTRDCRACMRAQGKAAYARRALTPSRAA